MKALWSCNACSLDWKNQLRSLVADWATTDENRFSRAEFLFTVCQTTENPPADSPNSKVELGLPPKFDISRFTQRRASCWSWRARLPTVPPFAA